MLSEGLVKLVSECDELAHILNVKIMARGVPATACSVRCYFFFPGALCYSVYAQKGCFWISGWIH